MVRQWASVLEVFLVSNEAGPSFVELSKETCDVRQDSHWTSKIGLSELAQEAGTATPFTDSVKNLELAKIPDGRGPFLKMVTKVFRKHHELFRRFGTKLRLFCAPTDYFHYSVVRA